MLKYVSHVYDSFGRTAVIARTPIRRRSAGPLSGTSDTVTRAHLEERCAGFSVTRWERCEAPTSVRNRRCSHSHGFVLALDPKRSVEGSILDGFADVFGGDRVGFGEVGDGAGDFEDAVVGAGAQV